MAVDTYFSVLCDVRLLDCYIFHWFCRVMYGLASTFALTIMSLRLLPFLHEMHTVNSRFILWMRDYQFL